MSQVALVQARLSSRRLPGKVLLEVNGKPLLGYLFERLARCDALERMVLLTSTDESDDPLVEWCERSGYAYRRGPLDDVVQRFLGAARALGLRSFVRINADSPLMDPRIVARVVAAFEEEEADLATNVFPRSFPKGESVEVVRTDALKKAASATSDPEDREHVTRYFYNNAALFRIRNVSNDSDRSSVQLSVDSAADLMSFESLVKRLVRPHWDYSLPELLALLEPDETGRSASFAVG